MTTENDLTSVSCDGKELVAADGVYTIETKYDVVPEITFAIQDSYGYVEVDGNAVDETAPNKLQKMETTGDVTVYQVKVYAEDFKTAKSYEIHVKKDYTDAVDV